MKHSNKISIKCGKHTFTLANIEVYPRMSEETTAFVADILIDGEFVGTCENSGKGEGNYPRIYTKSDNPADWDRVRDLYNEVMAEVVKHHFHEDACPEYPYESDWDYDADWLVSEMLYHAYDLGRRVLRFKDDLDKEKAEILSACEGMAQ